jgi:hypothetical protein
MTAEHQPTTADVYPHPSARQGRARQVRMARLLPHRQRLEAHLSEALERLEDVRQGLIARLDQLHGDTDFEPELIESNLADNPTAYFRSEPIPDEAEGYCDATGAGSFEEDEPSLGSQEGGQGGTRWNRDSQKHFTDGEVQCEDEGHDSDTELVSEDEGEPEQELCGWLSGEVDQTAGGGRAAAYYSNPDPSRPWAP